MLPLAMSSQLLSRLWECLRHRWINVRQIRLWLLVVVALYTLSGFFLVPWLAGWIAADMVREDLGRELRIGDIDFNPYTFTLEVTDFALSDPGGHELVAFDRLFVNFTLVSLIDQAWTLQQIRLEGPVIQEERFASGETRFARLKDDAAGEPEANGKGGMPAIVILHLDVIDGAISFVDHQTTASAPSGTTATIAVQEFALSLDDAALHENTGFPVHFTGQLKVGGAFSFDGEMRLSPAFEINGGLRVEALALSPAEPYLQQLARLAIEGGTLSLNGQLTVSEDEPLAYRGSAGVDGLSLVPLDSSGTEPVAGWQAMAIKQLDLSLAQRSLEASSVSIEGGSGRVIIHEDRTTNYSRLLVARADEGEDGEDAAPLHVSIAGIVLADSRLQFTDHSLPLPFSTRIHKLNGKVSTLASDTQTPADVQLEGQVGEYGLARIEGAIHAWQPTRGTNVTLTFRNLVVPKYSPYTVAFAGRRIAEGRMELDLGYRLADGKLEGSNAIVLHDLQLGEKVESPSAMDLPLSLAVALLKDSEGVIQMNIPVTGDLGDPHFELGGAIRSAIGDAIGNIVSAPFRFLAGLLGAGEEDLQRIAYPAGRSDLTPPQRQRVGLLRKALVKRPALALELAGPFDPDVDGPALKRQRAVEQLAEWLREQGREVEVSSPDLTAEPTQDAMEAIFSSAYPQTSLGEVRERFTREPDENPQGRSAFDAVAYRAHLAEAVIAAQPVTDADLVALGQARAAAVRDRLLADASDGSEEGTAVEPERILLPEPREVESENDEQVVMEVGLAVD
jgi:hypothetical protein